MKEKEITVSLLLTKDYQNVKLTETETVSPTDVPRINEIYNGIYQRLKTRASEYIKSINIIRRAYDYEEVVMFFITQEKNKNIKFELLKMLEEDNFHSNFEDYSSDYLLNKISLFSYFYFGIYGKNELSLYEEMRSMYEDQLPF
jgi:hypothetical protein